MNQTEFEKILKNITSVDVMGDVHFSHYHKWDYPVGMNFLSWIKDNIKTTPNRALIFLGDLVENEYAVGSEIELMENWYNTLASKYDLIIALVGNHDLKVVNNKEELIFSFLKNKEKLFIIDKPYTSLTICNKKCLFLPHIRSSDGKAENEYRRYYEKMKDKIGIGYDYAFGHVAVEGTLPKMSNIPYVPKEYIPAEKLIFGHIHNRVTADVLGSVWACNTDQDKEENRALAEIDFTKANNEAYSEIKLPKFINYKYVDFPNHITEVAKKYETNLYIVSGNISQDMAEDMYKDYYVYRVRNTLFANQDKKAKNNEIQKDVSFVISDFSEQFENMLVEMKINCSERIKKIVLDTLRGKTENTVIDNNSSVTPIVETEVPIKRRRVVTE
jgi:Icc-related predicted phosphoesterase